VVKILKILRIDSPDGETHFVVEEPETREDCECLADVREIKKISKDKASEPLLLFREE